MGDQEETKGDKYQKIHEKAAEAGAQVFLGGYQHFSAVAQDISESSGGSTKVNFACKQTDLGLISNAYELKDVGKRFFVIDDFILLRASFQLSESLASSC